jgi:hypothetical protein
MHAHFEASHAPVAGQTCYTSACHPTYGTQSLVEIHVDATATAGVGGATVTGCKVCHWNRVPGSRECSSCHADKVDGLHGYSAVQHTADTSPAAMSGTWTMSLLPTLTQAGQQLHPPLAYDFGCPTCHSVDLKTEHEKASSAPVNATACEDCHPSVRNSLMPDAWGKGCTQSSSTGSGCHTVADHQPHATNATLAAHSVAASYTVLPGGCSAAAGAGELKRSPCHTTDLIQEHNRKVVGVTSEYVKVIAKEIYRVR